KTKCNHLRQSKIIYYLSVYRKYSYYVLVGGIPLVIMLSTLLLLLFRQSNVPALWDEFGGFALHLPISTGLFWMLLRESRMKMKYFSNCG
ncbi:MAG: hypothetical protein ACI92W_003232, partial [Paraglaciecola sp.]